MEVSHFELIFKPQSPADPPDTGPVDSVLQGYFLEITNLEDKLLQFALDFVISQPIGAERDLDGNTVVFVDTPPGTDNAQGILIDPANTNVFRPSTGPVPIPPNGTAIVAVLPSVFGPVPGDPTPITMPNFEVRGYVRIRLPAVFDCEHPSYPYCSKPQSEHPVHVLLTPQNRATYFTAGGGISDQTQASLPLATGQAEYCVEPEEGGSLHCIPDKVDCSIIHEFQRMGIDECESLLALIARLDPEKSDLSAINRTLKEAGVGLALERRKGRS
ncbi:MAG: hypothetical protein AAFX56_17020 [Pseudomonadota bacterium]